MAKIRRFVVSQVEGNDANANVEDEIRPHGEIGLFTGDYIDSLQNDRLELLIFDGKRTHLRSKVLSPGRFYGYDADSSDGAGFDTIKLIPDETLRRNGSDQYLVVEPTGGEPGHVHIRAGGNIDQSNADLFLGGELTNVRVSDVSDTVSITTTFQGEGNITRTWTFDTDGRLTIPGSSTYTISEDEPGLVLSSGLGVAFLTNFGGEGSANPWVFAADGNITFPDGTVQETAYKLQAVPPTPQGSIGDKPGMIAGDSNYFYYCVAAYDGSTVIWHRVANDGNNSWSNL